MDNNSVKFKNWECTLQLGKYQNNNLAIELVSAVENIDDMVWIGSPIATATINVPSYSLKDNELCIKDYSENEGMLAALEKSGYITKSKKQISSGYVMIDIVEKTEKLQNLEKLVFSTKKMKP